MNYLEQSVQFGCAGESLLGIASLPETPKKIGVLIVVGGPQYRIGAHRQFVLLARHLAAAGYPCLRFDYRGMGDSSGAPQHFETIEADISAAAQALQSVAGVEKLVLWGLCDGASASLLYWHSTGSDTLAGICMLNPWVRSPDTLAQTQLKHYYGTRLAQAAFWKKLLYGQVGWQAIRDLLRNLKQARHSAQLHSPAVFVERMAQAWRTFPGRILVIIAGQDMTGQEFCIAQSQAEWHAPPSLPRQTMVIADADHTFSSHAWRKQVETVTLAWLERLS